MTELDEDPYEKGQRILAEKTKEAIKFLCPFCIAYPGTPCITEPPGSTHVVRHALAEFAPPDDPPSPTRT